MLGRASLVAVFTFALLASPSFAQTTLNVVPHGQQAPGVPWAKAPGILPADAQAGMYDRITPLFRNVTEQQLIPSADGSGFYKSSALLAENDPSYVTSETVSGTAPVAGAVSARIKRDPYGVPHIFSDTDAGAIFGAGYVVAIDQGLLLNQARTNGVAGLIDLPGIPAITLVLGLYDYKPSAKVIAETTAEQTRSIQAKGPEGAQLLRDIDIYLAGINARYAEASPATPKFTRTDIYALNAIKAQFLGEGGGKEIENALFLDALRQGLGRKAGDGAFADLRARNDPEASVTTARSFAQATPSVTKPRGLVRLAQGSFKSSALQLPGTSAAASALPGSKRQEASNILIASGSRSATGAPLFVGGPQIGFNYPGLTYELQLKSPNINVRGVSAAPFPGYMLIGRGADFAWTLTSAGADIIDTYAETLCGGSTRRYRYKGSCRAMTKVDAGTISKGGKTVRATFFRTVHGPVAGYAVDRATGKRVALAKKRSSAGQETVDQLFNQQMTFGRVKSAKDFVSAAQRTPQTFNSFYASATETTFYTSGALPRRPKGVNGDLPVSGAGGFEWQGLLPNSAHPTVTNPANGLLVNWNNKPARGFPAGDERFGSEGGIQRNNMLEDELRRYPKATLANVLAAANAGATQDVRITQFWPTLNAMLAKATSPSARATEVAQRLQAWSAAGGSRVDANGDGNIDNPGAVILDTAWKGITDAGLCGRLGAALCKQLEGRINRFDAPPNGQYAGWHQYMDKDLRTLLKRPVKGRYSQRYCGRGNVSKCATQLWMALDRAAVALTRQQGPDASKWTAKSTRIQFTPLPLRELQYTNKPSGIHQVMTFRP